MGDLQGSGVIFDRHAYLAGGSGIGVVFFFFQAEDGIRDVAVTGVQTCALPIWLITVIGCVLALGGLAATVGYVRADPMEYDLRNLRNDETARKDEIALTKIAEDRKSVV